MTKTSLPNIAATGIEGLDTFIGSGLPRDRIYLIEGDPGVGKTTLALQFLLEGVKNNEKVLLISLAENGDELAAVAASHGWDMSAVDIFSLAPDHFGGEEQYSVMQPSEIELSDTIQKIKDKVESLRPARVVIDSLSEVRLLAQNPLRYRRQILSLKHLFTGKSCTVLLLDDRTGESKDLTLQSLVHGVIELQRHSPVYGKARRKLQVVKLRGVDFQAGYHDFNIVKGGLEVYPRLVASHYRNGYTGGQVSSGSAELDQLLRGGIARGTTTLVLGPAGTGKSSLSAMYAVMAAERGEKAAIISFDEGIDTLTARMTALNMSLDPHLKSGAISIQQIDPAEMSPGEFMWRVKKIVEEQEVSVVVIDSLTGYLDAMPESQFLTIQMHEMLTYLNLQGVVTLLTMAQHGYIGSNMKNPADVSYLADTVILLRYFEIRGEIKKAISVVKMRSGPHETTIREYRIGPERITVGNSLRDFHGILTGTPQYMGTPAAMMESE
ncbi:MAG TPA: ATPase domain-containing protein [Bdellovibrionota bacterium]|nr:ATPase domain-containing protein [Bdellovibrionota bacterium]